MAVAEYFSASKRLIRSIYVHRRGTGVNLYTATRLRAPFPTPALLPSRRRPRRCGGNDIHNALVVWCSAGRPQRTIAGGVVARYYYLDRRRSQWGRVAAVRQWGGRWVRDVMWGGKTRGRKTARHRSPESGFHGRASSQLSDGGVCNRFSINIHCYPEYSRI